MCDTIMKPLFLLLWATTAQAQTVLVSKVPATVVITWDDTSPDTANPITYKVTVDTNPPLTIPAAKDAPCTACAEATITFTTTGVHQVIVTAVNSTATGLPAKFTVPVVPSVMVGPAAAVLAEGLVPPAASVVDSTGAVWTRSLTTVTCKSTWPAAQCYRVLRENVWVATGYEILYLPVSKRVYYHAPDGLWFEWHSPYWWTYGPTKPQ